MNIILLILVSFFPVEYPKETLNMTDAQYYEWATSRNKDEKKSWDEKFDDQYKYIHGSSVVTTKSKEGLSSGMVVTPMTASSTGGKEYSNETTTEKNVSYRYLNPDFVHPGPLTIVNPFVKPKKQWVK